MIRLALFAGPLGRMPQTSLGRLGPRRRAVYRFKVSFPAAASRIDAFQGASTRFDYEWRLVRPRSRRLVHGT